MRTRTPEQKAAQKAYDAARYAANPERVKKFSLAWAAANPEKRRASARKTRRKRAGIVDATDERRIGPCEICQRPADPLHLDHDHATGRIRGWLCYNCNHGLGSFRDSIPNLKAAITYLENSNAK
jgi:hypothetical protein